MQKRPGTRFNTYNARLSLSKAEDESLSSLSTRASQLKSDMRALRPTGFDIDKLDDELVLMALIRALPAEYNSLRQTLLLDDSLTLEKLQDTFVAIENQPGASSSLPVLSHAASTVTCTFCGRQNHSEAECYSNATPAQKRRRRPLSACSSAPRSRSARRTRPRRPRTRWRHPRSPLERRL